MRERLIVHPQVECLARPDASNKVLSIAYGDPASDHSLENDVIAQKVDNLQLIRALSKLFRAMTKFSQAPS